MAQDKTIKVSLAQMNNCVGAFSENALRILSFTKKAADEDADIIIFPELVLSSYPCLDLVDREDYRDAHQGALNSLITELGKIQKKTLVLLGVFLDSPEPRGRLLQNTALVIQNGKIAHRQGKQLLPTYDVFDEFRYFEPAKTGAYWGSPFGKLGVSVCEDAWYEDLHTGRILYDHDPAIALKGCDLAVNLSASPYVIGKQALRDKAISGFAKRVGAPLLYVNQVGANDEILFDGNSRILNGKGDKMIEGPSFVEGLLMTELNLEKGTAKDPKFFLPEDPVMEEITGWQNAPALLKTYGSVEFSEDPAFTATKGRLSVVEEGHKQNLFKEVHGENPATKEIKLVARALETGIRDYFKKSGFKQAIVGLSGGIDSAVIATLAARALGPENVVGITMPSKYSSTHSIDDSETLARNLGIHFGLASIKFVNSALLMELRNHFRGLPEDETEENLQARLRGTIVMAVANKIKALVITTGNKSEMAVGYCTLYGDMCGALAPLGDLYKTKVYELARYLNTEGAVIPESSLTKAPSAELRPNQTDQDNLPPYETLDAILEWHVEKGKGPDFITAQGFDAAIVKKVLRLVKISEFKRRQAAPVLKLTAKAFGIGRRYPVVRGF